MSEVSNTFSLLTYNVGLLRLRLCCCCCEVFANPPYAIQRLPHIPGALKSANADVIAIQECYEESHARFITQSLKDIYPYNARENSGGCVKFHNGLLFLSKYPIEESELRPYKKVAALERYLATKSSLVVKTRIPGIGKVTFVNMHTTAGGTTDPEHPDSDLDRQDELLDSINVCSALGGNQNSDPGAADPEVGIIIGDLNCGPEASPENFKFVIDHGYRDTYLEAVEAGRLQDGPKFTWDPENYLNQIGPHAHCPGQRCDHVLLPGTAAAPTTGDGAVIEIGAYSSQTSPLSPYSAQPTPTGGEVMATWEVESVRVMFEEQIADIGDGKMSTLSDHHGLLVKLRKKA